MYGRLLAVRYSFSRGRKHLQSDIAVDAHVMYDYKKYTERNDYT